MFLHVTVNKERKDTQEEFILRFCRSRSKIHVHGLKKIDLAPYWLDTMLNYSYLFSVGITVVHECSTPIKDNIDNFFTITLYHRVRCQ